MIVLRDEGEATVRRNEGSVDTWKTCNFNWLKQSLSMGNIFSVAFGTLLFFLLLAYTILLGSLGASGVRVAVGDLRLSPAEQLLSWKRRAAACLSRAISLTAKHH